MLEAMAERSKKQTAGTEKSVAWERDLPRLPEPAGDLAAGLGAMLLEGAPLEDLGFSDCDVSGQRIAELTASGVILERVSLAGCEISSLRLRDVRLVGCDLSNAMLRSFEATRVELVGCRMVGMHAPGCRWQSVLLDHCDARFAQLSEGRLRRTEICESHLGEAVLSRAELTESRWMETILRGADLNGARLAGLDLRRCEIEGMIARAEDLRGVRVTAAHALELARLLGVVID